MSTLAEIEAAAAAVSALLIVVMVVERLFCGYCLAIHVLNISLAVGYEILGRFSDGRPHVRTNTRSASVWFVVTFASTSLLLAIVERRSIVASEQKSQQRLQQAFGQAANSEADARPMFAPGRYYLEPKTAKVHVMIISDYQCPSCRAIDAQLRALTAGRSDVSISARHFPYCTECNAHVDKTRHPNSCRAALAAEAAGQIGGETAFWRMHDWLFERSGDFSDNELRSFVEVMGVNVNAFLAAMQNAQTKELIGADTAAADAAGLRFTPMILINGVPIDVGL